MLSGLRLVNLAINIPADVAAGRLAELGATVTKVEPPGGDPVQHACPDWYAELTGGQEIVTLDLKRASEVERLEPILERADALLTSSRPAALERLGLGWEALEKRHPRLVQVAIVGHPAPDQNVPGHDLTYLAAAGLLVPPALPRTLVADIGGAERAVSTVLALLHGRERGAPRYAEVALSATAEFFAAPLRAGLTGDGEPLGGGNPHYGVYRGADGWLAIASLEPHFATAMVEALGVEPDAGRAEFAAAFATRTSAEWLELARQRDLPIAAVSP